jgi:vancomycin permeability regulator SanA
MLKQKLLTGSRGKYILLALGTLIIIYLLSWLPWLVLRGTDKIVHDIESIDKYDVAIIFGGLHEIDGELSETNRERLLAGALLLEGNKVETLVISNTTEAATAMQAFLIQMGVPAENIELDTTAVVTEDTCVAERNNHPEGRAVIFVSHGYHLPRLIFACERLGVSGVGVAAEKIAPIERTEVSPLVTTRIRFVRYQREAILTLLNIFGVYGPTLEEKF